MGINDLQLSDEMIAALYPETLVGKDVRPRQKKSGETSITSAKLLTRYPFLGKNLRSICFLVSYPDDEFIPGEQLIFLLKILQACKCRSG